MTLERRELYSPEDHYLIFILLLQLLQRLGNLIGIMLGEGDAVEAVLYGAHNQFLWLCISIPTEPGVNMEINSGFHYLMKMRSYLQVFPRKSRIERGVEKDIGHEVTFVGTITLIIHYRTYDTLRLCGMEQVGYFVGIIP